MVTCLTSNILHKLKLIIYNFEENLPKLTFRRDCFISPWPWGMDYIELIFNTLRQSATWMCHQMRPTLVQIMARHLIDTKQISEPMMVYSSLEAWEQISVIFESKHNNFHARKWVWKCGPFCLSLNVLKKENRRIVWDMKANTLSYEIMPKPQTIYPLMQNILDWWLSAKQRLNIKMLFYLKHGNPHTWERQCLYWDRAVEITNPLNSLFLAGSVFSQWQFLWC